MERTDQGYDQSLVGNRQDRHAHLSNDSALFLNRHELLSKLRARDLGFLPGGFGLRILYLQIEHALLDGGRHVIVVAR
jgi:hypothetical protein